MIARKTIIMASLGALVVALASCGGSDDAERPSLTQASSPSFPVVVAPPLLEPEDVTMTTVARCTCRTSAGTS